MNPSLDAIRDCLEGAVPAAIATLAADGTPNVALLSQVHYVDIGHVALSFQFFNKTRENVLANPRATVQVVDPETAVHYHLMLEYLRTETEGPLFEHMKAKLAGIASHTGMSKVFRLLGSDVYRVLSIHRVPGQGLAHALPVRSMLSPVRTCTRRIALCGDLNTMLDSVLDGLETEFGIHHALLLMHDASGTRLYTVASRGYPASGVGSEIPLGAGVIGVSARERTPIRISHWTAEYAYSQAVRQSIQASGAEADLETEIPLPGLASSHSQLAVPILLGADLLGVLYVESPEEARFSYELEDALVILMEQFALAMGLLQQAACESPEDIPVPGAEPSPARGQPIQLRRYSINNSVFIGDDYLIKGVAGAIFWKLMKDHLEQGRTEFSNRELRLDPGLGLPDFCDNLEARLILLQRRLAERGAPISIAKTGRGRFRLVVERPVQLSTTDAAQD
jgi:GAF domain/Pyridoxamine 5'-phosphate oxidase